MMWGYDGLGFGGFGMGIGMLVFWGLLIAGIVLLVRNVSRSPGAGERDKTALDILRERYAKGEIDKAEFEQKRDDLKAG